MSIRASKKILKIKLQNARNDIINERRNYSYYYWRYRPKHIEEVSRWTDEYYIWLTLFSKLNNVKETS